MRFTSDAWLGLGVVLVISGIVVGFAIVIGKSIIWLFGIEQKVRMPLQSGEEAEKPVIYGAA